MIIIFIAVLAVWTVLVLYLVHLDRKIRELEERLLRP
ncbi:MAG: CcmD family protein [Candidatus Methanoperedens sp.]|nr:CcmD family protein [Candidatus Methanoperedens sp.]